MELNARGPSCHLTLVVRSRRVHFSFSLHVLLLLILLVVPMVQCLQLTYRSRGQYMHIFTRLTKHSD